MLDTTKKRGSKRCPSDFEISESMRDWAAREVPLVDIHHQTKMFRNHEFKVPRKDWVATWKNWMLKASENSKPKKFNPIDYINTGRRDVIDIN